MVRVSRIVSLESRLYFWFGIKPKRGPPGNSYLSNPLQFSETHNLVWADRDYLQRKLMAFICQLLLQNYCYKVVNCLNKNLITRFIWYIKKERCDIETFVNWQVIKIRSICMKKYAENMRQKLLPGPFLILVNNWKHPLHARNFFTNQILWITIIKKLLES